MDNIGNVLICPGCGKRYTLSDFKDDKLVCSACGREIPRFISVGAVDEAKYVKLYLQREFRFHDISPFLITNAILWALAIWLWTLDIWLLWKIIAQFFAICGMLMPIMEFPGHLKIRRIFKKNNYRLADIVCDLEKLKTIGTADCKTIIDNLENYVKAHAELNRTYERTGGQKTAERTLSASSRNYRVVIPRDQQNCEIYDFPPEQCPGCGKSYNVADFYSDNVQCRHCGKLIKIRCRVSDAEMDEIKQKFIRQITKDARFTRKIFTSINLLLLLLICGQIIAVGFDGYFSSWHSLSMCIFPMMLLLPYLGGMFRTKQTLLRMLDSDAPDMIVIEYYVKELASRDSAMNEVERAFAEFKKSLFDLYKSKGKVIGRY